MLQRRDCVFVGVDTHKAEHVAVVVNCWHEVLACHVTPNDPVSFPGFLGAVLESCPAGLTPVFALEGTGGLGRSLALFLAGQGFMVKEVNPVLTDRKRAHAAHPEKNDPLDAKAVAKVLVDEFLVLPDVRLDEHAEQLAQLVQHRDGMIHTLTQLKNRLHGLLHQQYPHYKKFFADPFCKVALAFWSRFPSLELLEPVDLEELGAFLREHSRHSVSTKRAAKILSLVSRTRPSEPERMRTIIIRQIVRHIELLSDQVRETEEEMAELLKVNGSYLTTMPGIDTVMAARLFAEIGDIRRFSSAAKLARFAGVAPLEKSSAGRGRRHHTRRGRRQLNSALYYIALTQISVDRHRQPRVPVAHVYYQKKLGEGKPKKSALRCLMRRLCEIIYAMMKRREIYKLIPMGSELPAA